MSFRNIKYIVPVTLILLLASVSGCKVGPKYTRPAVAKETQFRFSASRDTLSMADLAWVSLFKDDVLKRLVDTCLKNNLDMKIAYARVEEARANFKVARGQQWPSVGIGGAGGWSKDALPNGAGSREYSTLNATANVSWEIDLWGKLRRAKEAARANMLAQEAYQQSVRLMLINLVKAKLIAGTASGLVVAQAEAELALAKTQVPQLQMASGIEENYLSTLLGMEPHSILRGKPMLEQLNPPAISTPGIPSYLITRRPDIIMAEQALVAANANIGVARALMLPSLSVSGAVGTSFMPTTLIYNAVGNLVAPVFQGGKLRANVKVAEAQHAQMLASYQKTILTSLEDVSNALLRVQKMREIVVSEQETAKAAQTAFDLSNQLYNAGYASYLDVINAQSMLFQAQVSLSKYQSEELSATVGLYTALGGGWK